MDIYIQKNYCVYITHYHGSVKSKKYKILWEQELKENQNLFKTFIISKHYTKQEALYKELKLQQIFNVVKNPTFINQSYANPNGFFGMDVSKENNPNYNNKWSKSQRKYLSNIMKSKEVKDKIKNLNLLRRGVEHHTKTTENEIKKKETILKKYGVENISQCPEIKIKKAEKIKQTRELIKINKFGYDDKEAFIYDILSIAKEQNLYTINGKLDIGSLIKHFKEYGKGSYHALTRFCKNNNILYLK